MAEADVSNYVMGGTLANVTVRSISVLATPWAKLFASVVSSSSNAAWTPAKIATNGSKSLQPEVRGEYYYVDNFCIDKSEHLVSPTNKKKFVWKVESKTDRVVYVVKAYPVHSLTKADIEASPEIPEEKLREPSTLFRVDSPHVVKLCDSWAQEDINLEDQKACLKIYIQMEYVEKCMKDYIQNADEGSVLGYLIKVMPLMRDFAVRLGALHDENIVHRSIHLSALFFDKTFIGKIGGFGLSRFVSIEEDDKPLSPPQRGDIFVSPEQLKLKSQSIALEGAFMMDVYSLGVCFAAIVGKEPEEGKVITDLRGRITKDRWGSNNKFTQKLPMDEWWEKAVPFDLVRDDLKDLILDMVKEDPDNRPKLKFVVKKLESLLVKLKKLSKEASTDDEPRAKKQKVE